MQSNVNSYISFYERYIDDASFLWLLRSYAVNRPDYDYDDVAELEDRIESLLDALMTLPEESWDIAHASQQSWQASDVFVASIIAFRCLDVRKIQIAVQTGLENDNNTSGLASAMGWLPGRLVHSWIKKFLTSKDLDHKYLALKVCSVRREDPREYLNNILQRADCLDHEKLHARALRLIGELKRFDLLVFLKSGVLSESSIIKFWAHWALILLGEKSNALALQQWIFYANPLRKRAIEIAFRCLPIETAREWIDILAKDSNNPRYVINAIAVLGDPQAIDWIITQMRVPALTRYAGEAFATITGIDLEQHQLVLQNIPELDDVLPNDGAQNEELNLGDDQNLPFPDTNKVAAVWQKYQQRFASGQRYFLGQIVGNNQQTVDNLQAIYRDGKQRHRAAAALELSLLNSSQYLLNYEEKKNKE